MGNAVITFADGTKCYSGPNCSRHAGKQLAGKSMTEAQVQAKLDELYKKIGNPLLAQTPPEIDNTLADIYGEYYKKADEIAQNDEYIKKTQQRLDPNYRFFRERDVKGAEDNLVRLEEKKLALEIEAQKILDEAKPLEKEFDRRGGWTRAFLVDNTNGHVHKNRHCSTTYPTTRFTWLPDYSGKPEKKIVEDAGEKACTVCYPSAPVDVLNRPSKMEAPEKKALRIEREKAKAIKEAKNIYNPDGSALKLTGPYGDTIKSTRTAEISAVDALVTLKEFETRKHSVNPDSFTRYQNDYNILLTALANKHGRTPEEQDSLLKAKAEVKYKKEWK